MTAAPDPETDHGNRKPQILMLTHRVPFPPDRGDRIRSWNMLRHLADRADVSLACISDEPCDPQARQVLSEMCRRVVIAPVGPRARWIRAGVLALGGSAMTEGLFWSRRLARTLDHWADCTPFDVALVYCSSMLRYTRRRRLSVIPKVVDLVDADSQKWLDYATTAAPWKRPLYMAESRRIGRLERQSVLTSRAVTLVSDAEARVLRNALGIRQGNVYGLSNGVDTDYFSPQISPTDNAGESIRLAFVGALDYFPNVDGLRWFAETVWPRLRQKHPGISLHVIGRNPNAQARALEKIAGIRVVGPVEDVRPSIAQAHAIIAPLRIARGIQNKVLEAMAMEKPVLATPEAAEGIDAIPDKEIVINRTVDDWVDTVSTLAEHPELRKQFGIAARQLVTEQYGWSQRLKPLDRLLGIETSVIEALPVVPEQ